MERSVSAAQIRESRFAFMPHFRAAPAASRYNAATSVTEQNNEKIFPAHRACTEHARMHPAGRRTGLADAAAHHGGSRSPPAARQIRSPHPVSPPFRVFGPAGHHRERRRLRRHDWRARVAKAAPDGYQFVLGNMGTHAANQTFYKTPLYNAATDFTPVILIAQTPLVLLARNDLPADDLRQFIAYAKANQARMQYGSGGVGSASHLACALFNAAIGVNVTHVPYRGAAPAMQDLIAGRIDYQCPDSPIAIPQIESKLVKAIAVLSRDRSPGLPAQPPPMSRDWRISTPPTGLLSLFPKGTPAPSWKGCMPPPLPPLKARL